MKFHHIGIIVSDIDLGTNFLKDFYSITKYQVLLLIKKQSEKNEKFFHN
jgi:hypothetical protein